MRVETNKIPERPIKVTLALYMLYVSLGISVILVFVTWLRSGFPGPAGYWLVNLLVGILTLHFQAPGWYNWAMHEGLLILAILPIVVWFYFKIGKGRNWARITLLVFVILEVIDSALGVVAGILSSMIDYSFHFTLSDFLIDPSTLQVVLRIVAVVLLFGGISSKWFRAVKIHDQQGRTGTS